MGLYSSYDSGSRESFAHMTHPVECAKCSTVGDHADMVEIGTTMYCPDCAPPCDRCGGALNPKTMRTTYDSRLCGDCWTVMTHNERAHFVHTCQDFDIHRFTKDLLTNMAKAKRMSDATCYEDAD